MGKGVMIAAVAVVAIVAVAAVVFLLPKDKAAHELMPDIGSFPNSWSGPEITKGGTTSVENVSSWATGHYIGGPGPDTMIVTIHVFNSDVAAGTHYTSEKGKVSSPAESLYFAQGFTYTNASGTHHVFWYKNAVADVHLQSGTLLTDPDNDEWAHILSNIAEKMDKAKSLI
ncbi:MAG: hypothetical protein FWF40_02925 [Methanomassiliicoccaceae archaeon]|nr:hypothetical protein [Methanomassiliicoccaceae archaeon]